MMSVLILLSLLILYLFLPAHVLAVCPVCTVAIGAGVGLSRYLGIDDTVSGIWAGGLIISSSLWFSSWLKKKNISFPFRSAVIILVFYLLTVIPLYYSKVIGHAGNVLWGTDKLFLGMISGSVLFFLSLLIDRYIRMKNNGKVIMYYQRVILPVSLLMIGSTVFYIITKG